MMQLFQDLTEVLKAKKGSEIATINEDFLRLYESKTILSMRKTSLLEESQQEPKIVVGYLYNSIKRRAQTISEAYRLALQLLLAFTLDRKDLIIDLINKRPYNDNKGYLEDVYGKYEKTAFITDFHTAALEKLWLMAQNPPKDVKELHHNLADISITLTWVDTYYKTTYMPKDLEVIKPTSEDHILMREEIKHLLNHSSGFIEIIREHSFDGEKLWFKEDITNNDFSICGTASIVAGHSIFEIRTSETYPTEKKFVSDAKNLVGLKLLNDMRQQPLILSNTYIYYSRFKDLVEVVILDE